MAILYKVTATSGKYKDNDGNEKNRYVDMGVVMETKNGPMLKLEAVPVGWDGWAYLNDPKPKEGGGSGGTRGGAPQRPARAAPQPATAADDFADDDIPF